MFNKKEIKDELLGKVSGGDALEDAVRASLKEQEEKRLQEMVENVDRNREQRQSEELSDTVNNMIDALKKITGTEDGDGKIHIG